MCHNGITECVELEDLAEIYPDSLLAYINSSYIVVLGGTRPSGEVSNKAYAINSVHMTIHNLPDLPQGIKQGSILYHQNSIILINSLSLQLLSYTPGATDWTELPLTFQHSKYKRLKHFGCYLAQSTIFIISPTYKGQVQDCVYSFTLEEKHLAKTDQVTKFKLISPICLVTQDYVIVGGGQTEDLKANIKFYYKRNDWEWDEVQGPHVHRYENHPFMQVDNKTIFFNDLQVIIRYTRKFVVFNLKLPENLKLTKYSNKDTNGTDANAVKSKDSQRVSSDEVDDLGSVESVPRTVREIDIPAGFSVEESKLSDDLGAVVGSKSPIRGIEIQVREVKAKAPFLPSNVRKNTHLESESSFDDFSD